jgi:hypothetical protein|tara:strand:- start:7 stop:465 length:459 start_codon:yes stop_codon:yes gene_type:complete
MCDNYIKQLTSKQMILMYLNKYLPYELSLIILNDKQKKEISDNLNYHVYRYSNSLKLYKEMINTRPIRMSYCVDFVKIDHNLSFFNFTGISYKTVDYIHILIRLKNTLKMYDGTPMPKKEFKHVLMINDKQYSELSNKIKKMINIKKYNKFE